jgi:peptidoglycan/LPS O-acetylase OafA/YrhL
MQGRMQATWQLSSHSSALCSDAAPGQAHVPTATTLVDNVRRTPTRLKKMTPKHHLGRLDILRGVGALLVLYSHFFDAFAASPNIGISPIGFSIIPEGRIGVSLFCVVSGFIFEYLVRGRPVDYGRFIAARLWRIYPLYLTILLLGAAVFGTSTISLLAQALAFVPGFDPGDVWRAAWSIVIEFQFYLVFPFLTILLKRNGIKQLLLIAGFFFTIRLLLWGLDKNVNAIDYNTMLGRAPQFIAGMIAAKLFYQNRSKFAESPLFLIASLAALAVSVHYYHVDFGAAHPYFDVSYKGIYAVFWPDVQSVVFAAITLAFLQVRLPGFAPVTAVFAFIGKVSFSLYLTHRMIEYVISRQTDYRIPLQWTHHVRLDTMISCTLLEVPVAVALAALTFYAIEHPFQSFKKNYMKEPSAAPAAVATEGASVRHAADTK